MPIDTPGHGDALDQKSLISYVRTISTHKPTTIPGLKSFANLVCYHLPDSKENAAATDVLQSLFSRKEKELPRTVAEVEKLRGEFLSQVIRKLPASGHRSDHNQWNRLNQAFDKGIDLALDYSPAHDANKLHVDDINAATAIAGKQDAIRKKAFSTALDEVGLIPGSKKSLPLSKLPDTREQLIGFQQRFEEKVTENLPNNAYMKGKHLQLIENFFSEAVKSGRGK